MCAQVLGTQLTELKRVRAVAQYMHKELQMVPWTLTANFLKHRGSGVGQASKKATMQQCNKQKYICIRSIPVYSTEYMKIYVLIVYTTWYILS